MSYRQVHFHELADQEWVSIAVKGDITLEILEDIESFCHRQRARLSQKMQEEKIKLSEVITAGGSKKFEFPTPHSSAGDGT